MNRHILVILCLLFFSSCHHVQEDKKPKLSHVVQDKYLKNLPSPFPALSPPERHEDWGREYLVALGFAKELDLYQAMTAFKRAEFLLPPEHLSRKIEIEYEVLLCYYLGKKYSEAIYVFEKGNLTTVTPEFPAYKDLLIILYDCYLNNDEIEKAEKVHQIMRQTDTPLADKISLSGNLIQGDIATLQTIAPSNPDVQKLLNAYQMQKKSIGKAQTLNAILPGAGYFYIGQKQSGCTALLLNGLFIWASVYFFERGNLAAGLITTSFEAGWYFGGIYGAGLETKFYNERVYERVTTPMMNEKKLFPILMLRHAF
ncbi:MAG: tetratricopeptide repeat protein [Rhabdochlamydiaceae bacterium]|jgi:tetratricopeptide (TPR) repeat protein